MTHIKPEDIRVDVFRNPLNSVWDSEPGICVRVTHIPTGIIEEESEGRSQHANKAEAMERLRERLGDYTPTTSIKESTKELLEVAKALREYIDAIPKYVVLPGIPGVDRDWVDEVIGRF